MWARLVPEMPVERGAGRFGYAAVVNVLEPQLRPYNGAALASSQVPPGSDTAFCRECGKPIEADARFCRFCGKSQADPVAGAGTARSAGAGSNRAAGGSGESLESRLRQLFPRHHLQDEFMHISTIAAFFMAAIGFILGFFTPALGGSWLSTNFLLGAIALLLFLILRESTLSHIRGRSGTGTASSPEGGRYHAARRGPAAMDVPTEAATADSSPPSVRRPPAPR
jgi:zinc ribbon protein